MQTQLSPIRCWRESGRIAARRRVTRTRGALRALAACALGLALLASFGKREEAGAMLCELPEGYGLAARYPGDAGIEKDPAVVFADGFEDIEADVMAGSFEAQPGKRWDNAWGTVRITRDPSNVHSGRQAVEITHDHPRSHGADRRFAEGFEVLHVRYYMKYAERFPGCHHTGMALLGAAPGVTIGSSTGVRPDGANHFTALLDAIPPWAREAPHPPGYMNIYCYHMDQAREWGDLFFPTGEVYPPENAWLFAEHFVPRPHLIAERGRWHCYELMVKVNTPGRRDGRIAFWVDGKLAGDFGNLRLRSVEELKINQVILSSYSSRVEPDQTLWYDDVVVATSYIGPQMPGPR